MSGVKQWRDSGHYEAAVEIAGGEERFLEGVQRLKDEARDWRLAVAARDDAGAGG